MATIEEMARTLHENGYLSADMVRNWDGVPEAYKRAYRAGLLAVIEKHVVEMVQGYYEDGFSEGYAQGKSSRGVSKATVVLDVRPSILSALTAEPPRP